MLCFALKEPLVLQIHQHMPHALLSSLCVCDTERRSASDQAGSKGPPHRFQRDATMRSTLSSQDPSEESIVLTRDGELDRARQGSTHIVEPIIRPDRGWSYHVATTLYPFIRLCAIPCPDPRYRLIRRDLRPSPTFMPRSCDPRSPKSEGIATMLPFVRMRRNTE